MAPDEIVNTIIDELGDVYNESEIRTWLEMADVCQEDLPSDLRSHIWSIELKRTARDVFQDFPYYVTVPEFLDFWKRLSIAERFAHMASEPDDETPFGCKE